MKKLLLTIVLLVAAIGVQAQTIDNNKPEGAPKWRALTLNNQVGFGDFTFNTASANLFYELNNQTAITSWVGWQHRFNDTAGWASGQALFNKLWREGDLRLGAGVQYGLTTNTQVLTSNEKQNLFGVVEFSYRIKFR